MNPFIIYLGPAQHLAFSSLLYKMEQRLCLCILSTVAHAQYFTQSIQIALHIKRHKEATQILRIVYLTHIDVCYFLVYLFV